MQISAAFLCDFAEVREGLLMALGGGISRLWRPTFPTSIGATLAMLVEVPPSDLDVGHEIHVAIQGPDAPVGEVKVQFKTGAGQHLKPGESVVAPITIDLRPVSLPSPGSYSINVSVDGEYVRSVAFVAQPPSTHPTPGAPPPAPPVE